METSARVRPPRRLKRRRIIERPRLYALLDESSNRVRMLVASAGYGKTTLAEQWVARDGRRSAWFTARSASTDVAALALGIARAATELVPGCDERLRAHLRAVPNPGERVDVLAEILGEELAGWAPTDWLVLDEYQELVGAADAERFVEELVALCPIQLLIATRQRPTWVSGRSILYGDVLELNQGMLAMDAQEASDLLEGRSAASASGLVALANGWPAVIALASVSDAEISGSHDVPDSLYSFFAEEVFEALGDDVRVGLAKLAVAPILSRLLATRLLGAADAEVVCGAALEVGILEERDMWLELHPLARSFLEERSGQLADASASAIAEICYRHYTSRRDWDAAFEIITKRGPVSELEALVATALDDLLETARLPTIEAWAAAAARDGLERPLLSIARAEVALRRGRHAEAQAHAEIAAAVEDESRFRALSIAGLAAHLASREEEALHLYRRAEAVARSDSQRSDAVWGQLMCETELERPDAAVTLAELTSQIAVSDASRRVRAVTQTLMCQLRMGCIDLSVADVAVELLPAVSDPLVKSSFQSVYSSALALAARYEDALNAATGLSEYARRYRLDFALPYASISAAMAHSGMRQFIDAAQHLRHAAGHARAARDGYMQQLIYAVEVRSLAAQGRHEAALARLVPDLRNAMPAIRGEVLGSRALALASVGRAGEAEAIVNEIDRISDAVELAVLCPAVRAIASLKRSDSDLTARVNELEHQAFRTGAVDLLVAAYRATPALLSVLVKTAQEPDRLVDLVRRVGDADIARIVGQPVDVADDPVDRLSRREREVYELVCQGLRYGQVAQILFISEATVKVHVQHIFDKLGVRSREALAVHAALKRSHQATAARGSTTGPSS